MARPQTQYASAGDISIAYQVVGAGSIDLVYAQGWLSDFGGQTINTTGDGFITAFTGPTRSIQCAEAIRVDLARLDVQIRAGVHTGECERRGSDLGGLAVHIAARILEHAPPGEILVSGTVKDLTVGSGLEMKPVGTQSLKGVPGDWPLYLAAS